MNWTCPQIEERLSDYLEDALSVADRNAFQAHVHQCAQCRPLLAGVSGLVTAMHQVEPVEPPAGLVYRILEQTGPQERAGWFGLAWLSPRLAMGGVTMALAVLMVWPVLNNDLQNLTWSDLKPANLYHSMDRRATLLYARGVKFVNGLRVLHEIQSRLQPAGDPRAVPVKEELKKDSDDHQNKSEDKKKLEQNHALEPHQLPVMLAWMVGSLPGGAIR
jgi:hypothetical protein